MMKFFRFMEDCQQNNNNKRKYSDCIQTPQYEINSSSPSSFASSASISSSSSHSHSLPPLDSQFFTSVTHVSNGIYPPITHTQNTYSTSETNPRQLTSIPEVFPLIAYDNGSNIEEISSHQSNIIYPIDNTNINGNDALTTDGKTLL
jgi:hypothetical protein